MSEETRTKKEIEADITLKEAEARKTVAEAVKLEHECDRAELDLKKADVEYQMKHMNLEKEIDRHAKDKAQDDENFLYRFSGEVSGTSVRNCVQKLTEWHRIKPKCDIEIVFSSPGGSIIDGFELFDYIQYLRNEGHHITTGSLGYAASMAGILLQAGDTRWIGHQAWLMIHRAAFGAWGKTYEIEDEVKFIKRIEDRIIDIFTSRSNLTTNKIKRNWDRKDWWISADECRDAGLVDEIRAILPEHNNVKKKK
tara:strand:+ start:346 stop:1104 length:759 start_codon:yes stop_codon:yes gene_type:complete